MSKRTARHLTAATALVVATGTLGAAFTAPVAMASPPPSSTAVEEAAALIQPSIVSVETTFTGWVVDEAGQLLSAPNDPFQVSSGCTGFAVDTNGHIGTAGHCVLYDDDVRSKFVEQAAAVAVRLELYPGATAEEIVAYGMQNWRVEGEQENSQPAASVGVLGITDVTGAKSGGATQARIISAEPAFDSGDVALLEVDRTGLFAMPLGDAAAVGVGSPIVSVGFPALTQSITSDPTFKDGAVSAKTVLAGRPYLEVSAAISGGMSGGPTVDGNGDLVGVNSFGPKTNEAFNYVSASTNLRRLMDDAGVKNEIGAPATAYRAGLQAYFDGDYDTAVQQLDAAIAASPANATAVDYRNRAAQQTSFLPIWALTTIGIVVALLLGVGALLVWRRGRNSQDSSLPSTEQAQPAPVQPVQHAPVPPIRPMPPAGSMPPAHQVPAPRPAPAHPRMPVPAGSPQQSGPASPDTPANRPTSVMLDPLSRAPRCQGCARPMQPHTAYCAWCGARRTS